MRTPRSGAAAGFTVGARGMVGACGVALVLGACSPPPPALDEPPPPVPETPTQPGPTIPSPGAATVDLIDPGIPPAVAGEDGWNYRRAGDADLNGDGRLERVVLTARVELIGGRPAWDDGQPWQVYVEAADGSRDYLYAQRLQLGTLDMRIGIPSDGAPPTFVLIEHLPDRFSVYEGTYAGPGRISVVVRYQRVVDPRGEIAGPRLP